MGRIGLFPLELVLLPTEYVPLNVFEPRYKELVGECLERGEAFGIVLVTAGGDLHHVGTRASVAEVLQVLPDGRMHIVVEGGDRFHLLDVDHERSFDVGTVEELADVPDPAEPEQLQRTLELFRRLQETVGAPGEPPDPASPSFDFEIAARVDFDTEPKQELLELTSQRLRVARLGELLEHALEALVVERELRRRAHGNGKVAPLDS
jgi:Lon protease-like protein